MEGKVCIQCGQLKALTSFDVSFDGQNAKYGFTQRTSYKSRCKACYALRDRLGTKMKFIAMYGSICICCGESDPRFLTLDHVKDDGNIHRKDFACNQIMAVAIKQHRPDLYQILCYNCNCGKSSNGGTCPHKDITLQEYVDSVNKLLEVVKKPAVGEKRVRLTAQQQLMELFKNIPPEQLEAYLKRNQGP